MTIEFTTDDVIGALKQAIAINGSHHVQPRWTGYSVGEEPTEVDMSDGGGSCRYAEPTTGKPSCILGWAIFNLNREAFHAIAEVPGSAASMLDTLQDKGFEVSKLGRKLMIQTQQQADEGTSWGAAFAHGLSKLASA